MIQISIKKLNLNIAKLTYFLIKSTAFERKNN
jgi:hypothetical protein